MPGSKSLNKSTRLEEGRLLRNRSVRRSVKTRIAKAEKLIDAREELAQQETVKAISGIDKAVSEGVFHRNKGARLKSRLVSKLNAAVASQSPEIEQPAANTQQLTED
jgi:ribosomal protein S20